MGPVRSELMWQAVVDALEAAGAGEILDVLDLGGGTGGDAVRLALLGHRVTVVDPSADALASLNRRGVEAGLHTPVRGIQGDSGDLSEHTAAESFDLVLCHGVLEHVDDPGQALDSVASTLRPGGRVSVVVAGRNAAVAAKALAGDFTAAGAIVERSADEWDLRAHGPRRFIAAEVEGLLQSRGFVPEWTHGLRIFADLVPSALVDAEPGAREGLFALERQLAASSDFTSLSAGLHTIARLDLVSVSSTPGGKRAAL